MSPYISENAVPAVAYSRPLPVAWQSGVFRSPPDPDSSITSRPTAPVIASPTDQGERPSQTGVIRRRVYVTNGARTWRKTGIEGAKIRFFNLCRQRAINVTEAFFKTLESCPNEYKVQFFNKAACFFASVDASKITSTSTLTSMICRGKSEVSTSATATAFAQVADADIQAVARSVRLRSISAMYTGKGFPRAKDVATLLELPILHTEEGLNERLLSSISSLCSKKRCPDLRDLEALLTLPCLQTAGRPNQKVLQVISNIHHSKGIPTCQAVNSLLLLPCLRKEGVSDMIRLRALSVMCRHRGLPEPGHVTSLFNLIERYGGPDQQEGLLKCFSSLYRNRGMPDPEEQLRLLLLPGLQRDGQLDHELLAMVADANVSLGFPTEEVVLQVTSRLRDGKGSKLSLDLTKETVPATAETSSVRTTMVLGQPTTTTMSGQCQPVPLVHVVKPSPQGAAATDHAGSRVLNDASGASIAEQERKGRINTIINYLLDDDPPSAASIRPAYWTEELSGSAEMLGWLEEIIKADCSLPQANASGQGDKHAVGNGLPATGWGQCRLGLFLNGQ